MMEAILAKLRIEDPARAAAIMALPRKEQRKELSKLVPKEQAPAVRLEDQERLVQRDKPVLGIQPKPTPEELEAEAEVRRGCTRSRWLVNPTQRSLSDPACCTFHPGRGRPTPGPAQGEGGGCYNADAPDVRPLPHALPMCAPSLTRTRCLLPSSKIVFPGEAGGGSSQSADVDDDSTSRASEEELLLDADAQFPALPGASPAPGTQPKAVKAMVAVAPAAQPQATAAKAKANGASASQPKAAVNAAKANGAPASQPKASVKAKAAPPAAPAPAAAAARPTNTKADAPTAPAPKSLPPGQQPGGAGGGQLERGRQALPCCRCEGGSPEPVAQRPCPGLRVPDHPLVQHLLRRRQQRLRPAAVCPPARRAPRRAAAAQQPPGQRPAPAQQGRCHPPRLVPLEARQPLQQPQRQAGRCEAFERQPVEGAATAPWSPGSGAPSCRPCPQRWCPWPSQARMWMRCSA